MVTRRWAQIKEELKASSSHDFERRVLPLLRIRWPTLAHPKSLKALDRQGIDHVLVGSGSPLPVVVQCKGFEVHEPLGAPQIASIENSIASFRNSNHRCLTYLVLYNRFGTDLVFKKEVESRLQALVRDGKADKAILWDLNEFAKQLSKDLSRRIVEEIGRLAQDSDARERSPFIFGNVTIRRVPHEEGSLELRRHDTPLTHMSGVVSNGDPMDLIAEEKARWTLVIGSFGAGKSTLSRRLSSLPGKQLLYVPAASLTPNDRTSGSENQLTAEIVEYMGLFNGSAEFSDEERRVLYWLAGPLLSARLRDQKTNFVLLLDAIDENRFYSSLLGFQVLTTELSRANCKIVITTRYEHFMDHYATYAGPLGAGGPYAPKSIQLMRLHNWSNAQALEYVDAACALANGIQQDRLYAFRNQIEAGIAPPLATMHPLFLAMVVDMVADEGPVILTGRVELYRRWTQQKLLRDFRSARSKPAGAENTGQLVEDIIELMMDAALSMTVEAGDDRELLESIEESVLRQLAVRQFGGPVPSDIYTTTAFLEPILRRSIGGMEFRFFHRSFHEYFLALKLWRYGLSAESFPLAVRELVIELEQGPGA